MSVRLHQFGLQCESVNVDAIDIGRNGFVV